MAVWCAMSGQGHEARTSRPATPAKWFLTPPFPDLQPLRKVASPLCSARSNFVERERDNRDERSRESPEHFSCPWMVMRCHELGCSGLSGKRGTAKIRGSHLPNMLGRPL